MTADHAANLNVFTNEASGGEAQRWEGFQAGGGGIVTRREVILRDAHAVLEDGSLNVTFTRDGGAIEATVGALALPASWDGWAHLALEVINGDSPVTLRATVLGARGRLIEQRELAARAAVTLHIDLRDLPLAQGIRPPYDPTGIRIECQWGDTWPTEGARLCNGDKWERTAGNAPVAIALKRIALTGAENWVPAPLMDRYGQRIHGAWPTKVRDEAHMQARMAAESDWLDRHPPHADRDPYGGWTGGPTFEASGFFRVTQDEAERWWFVTPLGNPFWSIGTTGIRTFDCTVVTGREFLFEELPARDGPFATAYNPVGNSPANRAPGRDTVAFYRMNVLRKYGSLEVWRERVCRRFRSWGFNTIGNWSEEVVLDQCCVPHTRPLHTRYEDVPFLCKRMPDVWDAKWEATLHREVAAAVATEGGNPWLLGYFCDNEMPWGAVQRNALEAPRHSAGRDAFIAFIRDRYASLGTFNDDFELELRHWDDLREVKPDDVPAAGPATETMRLFAAHYADRYFATVSRIIRQHDPHHLYLGCRFVRHRPDDGIVKAAGRYADVVTVNMYDLWPRASEFGGWYDACDRPILIGEHHLPLIGPRQTPPLYPAFTDDERERLYYELVLKWSAQPYALGCHWYQHADQHITGRPNDGENQPVGFVDIADEPYPAMVAAARRATAHLHHSHIAGLASPELGKLPV